MVAGAGSGKTTSLVKALAHLEKQRGMVLRRRGQKVACITYTEVAVHEIWGDVGNDPLFHVSTIHSFLWSLVRPFQNDIKAWVRRRLSDKFAELQDEAANFGPRVHEKTKIKNAQNQEKCRNQLANIDQVSHFTYGTGSDYLSGILGHDDILKLGADLIGKHSLMRTIVAQRYPYVFIDESQDTSSAVIEAFKAVDRQMGDKFCLGFFGDPMQKIYATGAGEVTPEADWVEIKKPENFRCPTSVLSVINQVRGGGDQLVQTRGKTIVVDGAEVPVPGSARFFIFPIDSQRARWLEWARQQMAEINADPAWTSDKPEDDVRILVIVHRMAARRLGFETLFNAFNEAAPVAFEEGFRDGSHWSLQPFLRVLLPLTQAVEAGDTFKVMAFLRDHCPRLQKGQVRGLETATILRDLKSNVAALARLMDEQSRASVREVLELARDASIITLDDRFEPHLSMETSPGETPVPVSLEGDQVPMKAYLACPVTQLRGYRSYIESESPFSTQQGIKGAEFKRVLIVLDDEEGTHKQFSYGKLLGITPLSATDEKNLAEGKESVVDRTRKLFYVGCSRATKDLAVVLFTPDVSVALKAVREAGHFPTEHIVTVLAT